MRGQVRNVLWDDDESNPIHKILYFVIPSLHDYPTLPHPTKVRAPGNNILRLVSGLRSSRAVVPEHAPCGPQ